MSTVRLRAHASFLRFRANSVHNAFWCAKSRNSQKTHFAVQNHKQSPKSTLQEHRLLISGTPAPGDNPISQAEKRRGGKVLVPYSLSQPMPFSHILLLLPHPQSRKILIQRHSGAKHLGALKKPSPGLLRCAEIEAVSKCCRSAR